MPPEIIKQKSRPELLNPSFQLLTLFLGFG
jgi:hypothetical protein